MAQRIVVVQVPYRVSFLGGGTDYPAWYNENPGAVLSATIDRYIYITLREIPCGVVDEHRVMWRHAEGARSISEIYNPIVREALDYFEWDDKRKIEISYHADLPARAGLGSSSAFAVGLVQGLSILEHGVPMFPGRATEHAIHIERDRVGDKVGDQDHLAAAWGGVNLFTFSSISSPDVTESLTLDTLPSLEALQDHMMLVYLGNQRTASTVAADVIDGMSEKDDLYRHLAQLPAQGVGALCNGDIEASGNLVGESWMLKRQQSPLVSTGAADWVYSQALELGAWGGKMLGAGGGGFMLIIAEPFRLNFIAARMPMFPTMPVRFSWQGATAQMVTF